ncbi:unnamed protein product [Bursaphelenchus xylophilus]|uniref:(pine wood nematode) hypothetical protein n=1 Tax=Bursaphelenchus xylophilus TaxID=6326 RepID=A0A1I7RN62_BURXY|nr:unnamed protein product [Bursaphelenchus xylophilus]CAG9087737.1 unnamed protein product [Bursaphelenchus xylophilus]
MWISILLFFPIFLNLARKVDYRQVPVRYVAQYVKPDKKLTVETVNDCGTYAANNNYKVFVFYKSNGTCELVNRIVGYSLAVDSVQRSGRRNFVIYVKSDRDGCGNLKSQDAEQVLVDLTYGEATCPPHYNFVLNSKMRICQNKISDLKESTLYGSIFYKYRLGVTTDYYNMDKVPPQNRIANYVMNRSQATQTVKYTCNSTQGYVTFFGNTYYCYVSKPYSVTSVTPLVNNVCKTALKNGTPVKLFHKLIKGFLYINNAGWPLVGMYQKNNKWVYWDGKPVPSSVLDWQPGAPYAANGPLVLVASRGLWLYNSDSNEQYKTIPCIGSTIKRTSQDLIDDISVDTNSTSI